MNSQRISALPASYGSDHTRTSHQTNVNVLRPIVSPGPSAHLSVSSSPNPAALQAAMQTMQQSSKLGSKGMTLF